MSYENILLETVESSIQIITVNRPDVLNALNRQTLEELCDAVAQVDAMDDARVLLLTGAGGKAFIAGADISAMQGMSALEAKDFAQLARTLSRRLEGLRVPSVAVVGGYCLGGGCELAMSCDWILAGEKAVFGQPEVNLGVIPGFGGTQRLTRLVGPARAKELVISGRQVKADEAVAIGLANHVYPADELKEKALELARTIASKGPVAVRLAKEAVQRGQDLDLENALALERDLFALCFATEDQREGMIAFLEKRSAKFTGR